MLRSIVIAAASALALAACSTTVRETPPAGVAASAAATQAVSVRSVRGQASASGAPQDLVPRLTQAIQSEIAKAPAAGRPVDLEFNVVDYKAVSGGARLMVGMLAGTNRLHAVVTLRDPSGGVVRQFDVDRKANPGGFGAVTDQKADLINNAAKAVAQAVAAR